MHQLSCVTPSPTNSDLFIFFCLPWKQIPRGFWSLFDRLHDQTLGWSWDTKRLRSTSSLFQFVVRKLQSPPVPLFWRQKKICPKQTYESLESLCETYIRILESPSNISNSLCDYFCLPWKQIHLATRHPHCLLICFQGKQKYLWRSKKS